MQLCEKQKCTGCMSCVNSCPTNAIKSVPDEEGFLHPVIDIKKCLKCGKCRKSCPQLQGHDVIENKNQVYACWLKKQTVRKKSTSGGAFTAIARVILNDKGVVYGAGFDENLRVFHKSVNNITEMDMIRGSKYVQSDLGLIFREIKEKLQKGEKILFSGTPCQVAGLYACLQNRYEGQLWTIDLVCHGVPSPKVYKDYLDYLGVMYNSRPIRILFRNKMPGWFVFGVRVEFENGQVYNRDTYHDPYIRGFLRELFLRPSCHDCEYASTKRVADITLADFWGYQETCFRDRDNDKGISMVMVNTENGQNIFANARKMLRVWERPLEQAVNGNRALRSCFPPSEERKQFWQEYLNNGFEAIVDKYLYPEVIPEWAGRRLENLKRVRREKRKDFFKHLPNIVLLNILGEEKYVIFKEKLKGLYRRRDDKWNVKKG